MLRSRRESIKVSEELKQFTANGKVYKEDFISLNGSTAMYMRVYSTKSLKCQAFRNSYVLGG